MRRVLLVSLLSAALLGCSSKADDPPVGTSETKVVFQLDADFADESRFWDFPYPSDLRLKDGAPIATGFPNPLGKKLVDNMRAATSGRKGFPVLPTGYFRFDGALAKRTPKDVIAADAKSPIFLVDVDPASNERGKLFPVVAGTLGTDDYVPTNALGVAPRPGFVLHGKRKYAYVVRRDMKDAKGNLLGVESTFATLAGGAAPAGGRGGDAKALYAPLIETLPKIGVQASELAAATVFTTGDVVAELSAMSDALVAKYSAKIESLAVDPDDGAAHPRYCELKGSLTVPRFQRGKAPYDSEGLFEMEGGIPKKQGEETFPFTLSIPKQTMPKGGWPLVLYFHGSGGLSTASVDRGRWRPVEDASICPIPGQTDTWEGKKGCNVKGEGPAHVVAAHGFAMAGSALPVNPERLPGAADTAYINLGNLTMMRDLFQQGAIEQRLFLKALLAYSLAPEAVAACTGAALPPGETAHSFSAEPVLAMGQSMGGMYTNIIGAVEPKIRAVAPTGAGGYWGYFITKTPLYSDGAGLVAGLASAGPELDFLHPVLTAFETAVEPADPLVYTPRLARRPIDKHPTRAVYQPAGLGDSYFPNEIFDAMALAYGHKQAGDLVWPSMQDALKLSSLDGLASYPLTDNLKSEAGVGYTGAVTQYKGDGVYDPHAIYTQLDAVQYQYGCFFRTFLERGKATIPAPAPLGTPCP
jgi:hypothetical protein